MLIEQFIASFKVAPDELVLDFDATGNRLYGQQEGRFFHGYYDNCCYLPLYVFCGQQLLCAYLRPSDIDGARHAGAILKLLARRLRQVWPDVRIVFRGDSGFCRQRILNWCERSGVHYIVGLARNRRLQASNWPSAQVFAHAMSQLRSPLKGKAAPGRRDDTKTARNPSRGGGGTSRWCLRAIRA